MYEYEINEVEFGFSVEYVSGRKKVISGFDTYYKAVCVAEKYLDRKNVVSCSVGYLQNGTWCFAS